MKPTSIHWKWIVAVISLIVIAVIGYQLTKIFSQNDILIGGPAEPSTVDQEDFELPSGPILSDVTYDNPPLYIYLFTHTEDPFNHELYEERYRRSGEMVAQMAQEYPDMNLTWIIEFMGADAEAIADRNAQTGLVDYLVDLHDQGLVEFGYHAHHEPTYMNRPQTELSKNPSYDEVYDAMFSWITCVKDLAFGGCVQERGGGLEAVLNTFGEVEVVTGVGSSSGVLVERSAGAQAIHELLPDRLLGFGFPDHGSVSNGKNYEDSLNALMETLTPTNETHSGVFWMDGALRINDAASIEGVNIAPLIDGSAAVMTSLQDIPGDQPMLVNAGIASKYSYTTSGTSPTKWGYANPDSPELPDNLLLSEFAIAKNYAQTEKGFQTLITYMEENNGVFVNSDEAVDLFVNEGYWTIDESELENIALWILNEWSDAPPNWVYDGEQYYSLADAFSALVAGINKDGEYGDIVDYPYGPWSRPSVKSPEASIAMDALLEWAAGVEYENNQIAEEYRIDGESYTATQMLYALAMAYTYEQYAVSVEEILIPEMLTAPETYDLLEDVGCSGCFDSAWSLKPARFQ